MLEQEGSLYFSKGAQKSSKIFATDLDWTLIRTIKPIASKNGLFHRDSGDWAFLPNRIETLKSYQTEGFTIVIFTNQGYVKNKLVTALDRIKNVISKLIEYGVNPWVFIATEHDQYRKPNTGMWTALSKHIDADLNKSFHVGDAAGRPQDHSDDDLLFAQNNKLKFYVPEEIFKNPEIGVLDVQTMFIFVGMPGSGKTSYFNENLKDKGWVHANQDTLKTAVKVLSTVKQSLAQGKSVAVDATNPTAEKRAQYIDLAIQYQVPTLIIYFVGNGFEFNRLREHPVPSIAYSTYFKNLQEPSEDEGVPVIHYM